MPKKQPVNKTTLSITEEQIAQLRALMPQVFTEGKVDFDKLHASLGDFGNESPERYSFSWAGKRDAIRILQTPSRATLIPARKESVDFDKTQNIFIEGDNLEVLKLLYKPYFGQVKMIYIDPPYNTGNDFVYPDNFADPLDTYLKLTGQKDSEGNLLTSNAETSGRYHSAWLSMMYPRLFLARQLLTDDGVIFISIDNIEVNNLKMVMNEIFGEENFIECLVWNKRIPKNDKNIGSIHEYVLAYAKNNNFSNKFTMPKNGIEEINDLRNTWIEKHLPIPECEKQLRKLYADNDYERGITLYNSVGSDYRIWGKINLSWPNANTFGSRYKIIHPKTQKPVGIPDRGWRWKEDTFKSYLDEANLISLHDGSFVSGRIWFDRDEKIQPSFVKYLDEVESLLLRSVISLKSDGGIEVEDLFGNKSMFSYPKPTSLIKMLVNSIGLMNADIVLDFFAGSATIAQAVLELNREDGCNRKFILVQLPEPTGNKEFSTIAEIGKERIRRVIKKMKKEREGQLKLDKPEDLGFKVFKLRESNYKQWDDTEQKDPKVYAKQMEMLADPLVKGWKEDDVLYEVALKEGYGLNVLVEATDVKGIQKVSDSDKEQSFYLCLADKVKMKDVKPLNLKKDDLFICRDIALDDESAANLSLQCRLKTI